MAAGVFADVNWAKFCASLGVGAAIGGAYNLFDQTILHRRQRKNELPGVTDFLRQAAPDIVRKMEQFYLYRNVIPDAKKKEAFRHYAQEVLAQSEFVAALYNQVTSLSDDVEPTMQIVSLYQQLNDHTLIVVRFLRMMLALIDRVDDVKLETAFNEVYECFNNRLWTVQSRFRN